MGTAQDEREQMLALLQSNHTFPGRYAIRVVVAKEGEPALMAAVQATALELVEVTSNPSRTGKWTSVRLVLEVQSAEEVLTLYEVVNGVEGVVTSL